jgi:hypothetical protein
LSRRLAVERSRRAPAPNRRRGTNAGDRGYALRPFGYRPERVRIGLVGLIYIFVGVFVAASQDYLDRLGQLRGILTAILGILLWPLLLLGLDVRIR